LGIAALKCNLLPISQYDLMRRRVIFIVLLIAVTLAAVSVVNLAPTHSGSQSSKLVKAVKASKAVPASAAQQTASAFIAGRPLATARSVGDFLLKQPHKSGCGRAEHMLAVAGSPTLLKEDAAELDDPITANLTADLITDEGQFLEQCGNGVPGAEITALKSVEAALSVRLEMDSRS